MHHQYVEMKVCGMFFSQNSIPQQASALDWKICFRALKVGRYETIPVTSIYLMALRMKSQTFILKRSKEKGADKSSLVHPLFTFLYFKNDCAAF